MKTSPYSPEEIAHIHETCRDYGVPSDFAERITPETLMAKTGKSHETLAHCLAANARIGEIPKKMLTADLLQLRDGRRRRSVISDISDGGGLENIPSELLTEDVFKAGDTPYGNLLFKYAKSNLLKLVPKERMTTKRVFQRNVSGATVCHYAAASGCAEVLLNRVGDAIAPLSYGPGMTLKDDRGWTPIHYAAEKGTLDKFPGKVNSETLGALTHKDGSVISIAAMNGNFEKIPQEFVTANALRVYDSEGNTVIHHAAAHGSLDHVPAKERHVTMLLEPNFSGEIPLHKAAEHGWLGQVGKWGELTTQDMLVECDNGRHSFHYAAKGGHLKDMGSLLTRDILSSKDCGGANVAWHAARGRCLGDVPERLRSLPLLFDRADGSLSAASVAAQAGDFQRIVEWGGTAMVLGIPGNKNRTLLHDVSKSSDLSTIPHEWITKDLLLRADADGVTPMMNAAATGQLEKLDKALITTGLLDKAFKGQPGFDAKADCNPAVIELNNFSHVADAYAAAGKRERDMKIPDDAGLPPLGGPRNESIGKEMMGELVD